MLNDKQQRVVELTNNGRTTKYIAKKLQTTERAVKTYITKLTRNGHLNGDYGLYKTEVETPALTPAKTPAIITHRDQTIELGAAVEFLQAVGGVEQARRLIEKIELAAGK